MSSKIRDMKETIVQQNEMVKTLRSEKQAVRDTVQGLYTALIKYKIEYDTNTSAIETGAYPSLTGEDMTKLVIPELLRKVGEAFSTVADALAENRAEVRSMYKELDQDVSAALSEWESIQAQDRADKKALAFRDNLTTHASRQKASTPEPVVSAPVAGGISALPPTPPESTGKKEKSERPPVSVKTDKSKNATKTLEELISPAKGTAKNGTKRT